MNQSLPITAVVFGTTSRPDLLPSVLTALDRPADVLYLGAAEGVDLAAARGFRIGTPATDMAAALTQLRDEKFSGDALLISLDSDWPQYALPRLLRAAAESAADVIAPLGPEDDYTPLPETARSALDHAAIDTWCQLLGDAQRYPRSRWPQHVALWRASAWRKIDAGTATFTDNDHGLQIECLSTLYVGRHGQECHGPAVPDDRRDAPPASPLSVLRELIGRDPAPLPLIFPGLDGRPVLLHILHSWGGGIEGFVRDLADGDNDQIHLALCAGGQFARRRYGETLKLHVVAGGRLHLLRQWPLPMAISDTAIHDAASATVLAFIVQRYAVSRVMVSSLIGHSLDVLRTGLSTIQVCHDYYPIWPILHADFGAPQLPLDRAALPAALRSADDDSLPFDNHGADYWWRLRSEFIAILRDQKIILCAPTASVRDNWLRLAPELSDARFEVIAHGFRPFVAAVHASSTPHPLPLEQRTAPDRLRLLVLGRINGGKALHLLQRALPRLTERADVFLLGCGSSGHALFGKRGVHVLLDYQRAQLPELIARIAPDAALLPATVAESFSYTLSELWALGVPPVASRMGSFAERIDDGRTGLLFDADVDGLIAAVDRIRDTPSLLPTLRTQIAAMSLRSLVEARADYAALFPPAQTPASLPAPVQTPASMHASALAETAIVQRGQIDQLQQQHVEQRRELVERGEWTHQVLRENAQMRHRLDTHSGEFMALQSAFEERSLWAESLDAETRRLGDELHIAYENYTRLEQEKADADAGWSAEIARLEGLRTAMMQSTSWQLTRPLRAIVVRLRDLRARLGYWRDRLIGLPPRVIRSLRTRGVRGTLQRIQQDTATTPLAPAELSVELGHAGGAFDAFAVPRAAHPKASIIIPVYNKFPYTLACLQSIAMHGADIGFEVIVVDDCSSDETRAGLARIDGISAIHNEHNLGFIGACNAGAAAARGDYLVFLNNDTQVTAHWLDALIDTFDQHRDVGLVGAKLVYPDGRLQEAGGIVFSDASGWNYGRFADPRDPAYNYVREVDYCSGAAIAITRALFNQRGGFDTRYAPAYYEDTDIAFQVREAGLRVLYQPASTVIHFEGITSGTDVGSGTKRYQVINQEKFAERWRDVLPQQPKPGTAITLAREHRVRGRMLIVDATIPEADKDSGSVRMVNLLRALVELGWKVSFCSENRAYVAGYTEQLQQLGVETPHHPYVGEAASFLRDSGTDWDVVMLSRHYVATPLLPLVRHYAPRARLIFDTVDLHYLREERAAALENKPDLRRAAAATKLAELRLIKASDITLVVSPVEQSLLRTELPTARIEVLSNVHEVVGCRRGFDQRRDIFFVGGFQHQPNVDAVQWFVAEIWPLISARLPELRFHIIGSRMPDAIRALADERIIATGFVESLDEYLDGCRLSVAPLRYGAGVKGKVNQSMAHGQPVVATALAAEGMFLQHDIDVLIADTPADYADAVVRLYTDAALWQRVSAAGLDNVAQHFSFDAARAVLADLLKK